jgi:phosphoribosylanthranilate isomerase
MSFIVKICGLSTPEALEAALDAGADMVGFVFFPPSPRRLAFNTASALSRRVRARAQKVALTVDADDGLLADIVAALQPDMLQLTARERPRVAAIKNFGLPIARRRRCGERSRRRPCLRGGRRPAPVRRARPA